MTDTPNVAVARWLGEVPYQEAWDLQRSIRDELIAAKRADPPVALDHQVLGVQHPPVYTLGKSADETNLLASSEELDRIGAETVSIDRGGDITFHGPGQLVVYPVLDLDRIFRDLGRYLRALEDAVIGTLAEYEIAGTRVDGRTGVWVGPDERGPERKICAMGIHCSRWVTTHGLALNVSTDLDYFDNIIPCGIRDRGVTSIAQEIAGTKPMVDSTNAGNSPRLERVFELLTARLGTALGLALKHDHGPMTKHHESV